MARKGSAEDTLTLNKVLNACEKSSQWRRVLQLFTEVKTLSRTF